jgi:hypothetical protein
MANARVTHRLNPVAIRALLSGDEGPVAKELLVRGYRVQSRAKQNLSGSTGSGPKRVDTGRLRASITVQLVRRMGYPAVRIGTNVKYGMWVHDGTGLYGPRHSYIYPKTKRYMRWRPKGSQGYVYAKRTKGMRGNPFLTEALEHAKLGRVQTI